MTMISDVLISQFRDAIQNPIEYTSGVGRKTLQAAFDMFLGQISESLFDGQSFSRFDLRMRLNSMELTGYDEKNMKIIGHLKDALKNIDQLYDKSYDDHVPDIKKFIENHLVPLLEMLSC